MATYPLGIKRFTTKRDLLDDVDAAHINDMQSEITAIEDMLGPNPHQDAALDYAWRWPTLKARLEYMIRGKQLPVWDFYQSNAKTFYTDTRSKVVFPSPSSVNDTHGLFSNSNARVKRSGYYHVTGRAYFAPTAIRGNRVLIIESSRGTRAMSSQMLTGTESQPDGLWLQVVWEGYLAKGDTVSLYTSITTGAYTNGKYTVDNMGLSGFMIRDA